MAWLLVVFVIGLASAGGIGHRAFGYPDVMPAFVVKALAAFIEPGLAVWWFTLGGVFQSFPNTGAGYAVTFVGNVVFWYLLALAGSGAVRFARRRFAIAPRD